MEDINMSVEKFIEFRTRMNVGLSIKKARYIWGKRGLKELNSEMKNKLEKSGKKNIYVDKKVKFVKENINELLVLKWVKFIGVSGSVAAGFAKEEDDIDIFIVVKDGCAWLYRGILTIRGLFNGIFRAKRHGDNVKDKFCLNLICEEKGVLFSNDIFDFHELMFLIPVYNSNYINYILSKNKWLVEDFGVKKELLITRIQKDKECNLFIKILNYSAFISQLLFMLITKHSPNIPRLKENYKKGRIEFFEKDYKESCINMF